jgi:1-deoxy-D-xylulose-5-phosphate reductoisomerase
MRIPIQYALTYPHRVPSPVKTLRLPEIETFHFYAPDPERFPCLQLAYDVLSAGGSAPCAMNAANEVAVLRFLEGQLTFPEIHRVTEEVVSSHRPLRSGSLEELMKVDAWAREEADRVCRRLRTTG